MVEVEELWDEPDWVFWAPGKVQDEWPEARSELRAYARYMEKRGAEGLANHLRMAIELAEEAYQSRYGEEV